jgi:NADH:ubiquinone oxidoreductase subunit
MGFNLYELSMRAYLQLKTWRYGELVGIDTDGNRYYRDHRTKDTKRERRWVVFNNGESEATRVPAEWHGWLHYQIVNTPEPQNSLRRSWQKQHAINLTGTAMAYLPQGHILRDGQYVHVFRNYEPWEP